MLRAVHLLPDPERPLEQLLLALVIPQPPVRVPEIAERCRHLRVPRRVTLDILLIPVSLMVPVCPLVPIMEMESPDILVFFFGLFWL